MFAGVPWIDVVMLVINVGIALLTLRIRVSILELKTEMYGEFLTKRDFYAGLEIVRNMKQKDHS